MIVYKIKLLCPFLNGNEFNTENGFVLSQFYFLLWNKMIIDLWIMSFDPHFIKMSDDVCSHGDYNIIKTIYTFS